jgi:hypothetical protein
LAATSSKDTTVPRLSGENQGLDGPLLGDPAIGDNSCWETMVALEEGAYPTVVPKNEISTDAYLSANKQPLSSSNFI